MEQPKIASFVFEGVNTVRVSGWDGRTLIVAADLCRGLCIKQPGRAIRSLDSDEKGVISIHTPGGQQTVLAVTEGGCYTLIMRSRQAVTPGTPAHRFRRWVVDEVLPAVRGDARAMPAQAVAVQALDEHRPLPEALALRMVRVALSAWGAKAARQVWIATGLPIVPAMRGTSQGDLF